MAQIVKELSLDVAAVNRIQAVLAKQYDYKSRYLLVQLTDNGINITVESTSVVTINASRADGESAAFLGTVETDGRVRVPLAYWMLELDDVVKCDISVVDTEGRKLTTTNFTIEVEHANYSGEDIEEDENYDLLVALLEEVAQYQEAEAGRVTAEAARVTAEDGRVTAETARGTAETARASAETARASAETSRASAETSRANAETTRQSNESARVTAETARDGAETLRATAETLRQAAETARDTAEAGRASAEVARNTAESERASATAEAISDANTAAQNAENAAQEVAAALIAGGIIPIYDEDHDKYYTWQIKIKNGYPVLVMTEATATE